MATEPGSYWQTFIRRNNIASESAPTTPTHARSKSAPNASPEAANVPVGYTDGGKGAVLHRKLSNISTVNGAAGLSTVHLVLSNGHGTTNQQISNGDTASNGQKDTATETLTNANLKDSGRHSETSRWWWTSASTPAEPSKGDLSEMNQVNNPDTQNQQNNQRAQPQPLQNQLTQSSQETWAQWLLYTSGIDSLYKHDPKAETEVSNSERKKPETQSVWFGWFRATEPESDDSDAYSENGADLIRTARLAIESSKDSSHYAIKYGVAEELILSVSETQSETQPVHCRHRRRPRLPNELQELLLQPLGAVRSSNSSIRSGQSLALHETPKIPHIVFPSIAENLRVITVKTQLRLLGQHVLYLEDSSECHIYRRTPAKISRRKKKTKKVVVIGVHTFLPAKLVKTAVGQPTGNAVQFVKQAANAVRSWLGGEPCEIETIALDGEGKVADRVSHLLRLLQNWLHLISDADFLFVVAHSQGVIIGLQLLAELLDRIDYRNKRIGFLSMAGPFHGPLPGLDTKVVVRAYSPVENVVIKELVELQRPKSYQSQQLRKALSTVLDKNVKVTLCGTWNDQFVPLYSALATGISHPNLFRIFHSRTGDNLPPFLVLLLQAAALSRNMGHPDYNVIYDLSEKCLGFAATGGHGRVFEDFAVYDQAILHALETTDLFQGKKLQVNLPVNAKNPYQLPWNIRSLLHEILHILHNGSLAVVTQLIIAFKHWEPTQRHWRDLKYALDAFEEATLQDFLV